MSTNQYQRNGNFLCAFLSVRYIGYGIMCGDALTGYKALFSSRDCSGESMFCFYCCVYKILPPFTDTVHEQLSKHYNHLERPAILLLLTLSPAAYPVSSHFDHFNLK